MRSINKRFGVLAGFVILLILLAMNTVVLRRSSPFKSGIRSGSVAAVELYRS